MRATRLNAPRLVKLFASILICEGDEYFLVTPVEKWRIKVDVAPLFVIAASREHRGWSAGYYPNHFDGGYCGGG